MLDLCLTISVSAGLAINSLRALTSDSNAANLVTKPLICCLDARELAPSWGDVLGANAGGGPGLGARVAPDMSRAMSSEPQDVPWDGWYCSQWGLLYVSLHCCGAPTSQELDQTHWRASGR